MLRAFFYLFLGYFNAKYKCYFHIHFTLPAMQKNKNRTRSKMELGTQFHCNLEYNLPFNENFFLKSENIANDLTLLKTNQSICMAFKQHYRFQLCISVSRSWCRFSSKLLLSIIYLLPLLSVVVVVSFVWNCARRSHTL